MRSMRSGQRQDTSGFGRPAQAIGAAGALAAALATGWGRAAIATTDALPVHRVVVYRNGVAYSERAGHVDRDEVRFKMKPSEVGDFLATLAVMERGGSSVRAAATFPLNVDDDRPAGAAATGKIVGLRWTAPPGAGAS